MQAFDYWVSVHSLHTSSEGSILDPDDTLSDVVDDREQVSGFGCCFTLNEKREVWWPSLETLGGPSLCL